jgi:hypothetical protein
VSGLHFSHECLSGKSQVKCRRTAVAPNRSSFGQTALFQTIEQRNEIGLLDAEGVPDRRLSQPGVSADKYQCRVL